LLSLTSPFNFAGGGKIPDSILLGMFPNTTLPAIPPFLLNLSKRADIS
jgi:hypothetical protein